MTLNLFTTADNRPQNRATDFRSYLQGLKLSEWAIVSMMRIVDAIMFHDHKIVDGEGNPVEDKTDSAVRLFTRPNTEQTWADFIEMALWFWLPLGNAFIWLRPSAFSADIPAEMHVLWPDKVTVVPHKNGLTIKEYKLVTGSEEWTIPREQMLHLRFGNPFRRHWGLGRMEASERTYDMDIAAADYAYRYFEADATPGGVLQTPGRLHPQTREFLKQQWKERHQGKGRAHNWAILEEGLTWTNPSPGPRESMFLDTRKSTREVILGLYGVTPLKAGITEGSNRATAFVQERSWQRDAIAPLLKRLDMGFSTVSVRFGDRHFKYEELVQEDSVEDVAIAQGYFGLGALTPNEVRTIYAGLPRLEQPGMDLTYLPVSVIPTGETPPPVGFSMDPNRPGATVPADPLPPPAPPPSAAGNNGHVKRVGTPLQQRVLRSFRQQQLVEQRRMQRQIAAFFREQGAAVVERFLHGKAVGLVDAAVKFTGAGKFGDALEHATKGLEDAFDMAADDQKWMRVVRTFFSAGLQEEFTVTSNLLGYDPPAPFEPGGIRFEQRMRQLASKVSRVSETTRAGLDAVIRRGMELGLGPTSIAEGAPELGYEGIRGTFDEFARSRAQLIARTESSRLLDQANTETYRQLGVTVCDVIGCEDEVIMPGQKYGCNSVNIPMADAEAIEFHPNHKGAIVPRITAPRRLLAAFDNRRAGLA